MRSDENTEGRVAYGKLREILEVTRKLAQPFDLNDLLEQVVDAGRELLDADRGTVFLYEEKTDELVAAVATGIQELRVPADKGIVGEVARTGQIVNVPDCYADPRFNPDADTLSGYRTRCLLAVPLVGFDDSLVGVLQLLNKREGAFDGEDEEIATVLAAQCAVALQRARTTRQLMAKERVDRELAVAREIQMNFVPTTMPALPGYDIGGMTVPAEETGGDTFDLVPLKGGKLMVFVGDATGHGVGPALSVTQVRAMIRLGIRLGAELGSMFRNVNDQLTEDLPSGRFVMGFLGVLEPEAHRLGYHSGGQGPLLHFHAKDGSCDWRDATTIPLGMMETLEETEQAVMEFEPGDIAGIITDGVFEAADGSGEEYGTERTAALIREHQNLPMPKLAKLIFDEVTRFGAPAPQADDITIVLVRRLP